MKPPLKGNPPLTPVAAEPVPPAPSAGPAAADPAELARNLYELHNWLSLKRR